MSFKRICNFDVPFLKNYKTLHLIAHLQKAKNGEFIQVLKNYKNGDIIIQKENEFYLCLNQDISCLETIQNFFNVNIQDIMLSSCIFSRPSKGGYPHSIVGEWNWNKIHRKLDMVKMQFLHYN